MSEGKKREYRERGGKGREFNELSSQGVQRSDKDSFDGSCCTPLHSLALMMVFTHTQALSCTSLVTTVVRLLSFSNTSALNMGYSGHTIRTLHLVSGRCTSSALLLYVTTLQ